MASTRSKTIALRRAERIEAEEARDEIAEFLDVLGNRITKLEACLYELQQTAIVGKDRQAYIWYRNELRTRYEQRRKCEKLNDELLRTFPPLPTPKLRMLRKAEKGKAVWFLEVKYKRKKK